MGRGEEGEDTRGHLETVLLPPEALEDAQQVRRIERIDLLYQSIKFRNHVSEPFSAQVEKEPIYLNNFALARLTPRIYKKSALQIETFSSRRSLLRAYGMHILHPGGVLGMFDLDAKLLAGSEITCTSTVFFTPEADAKAGPSEYKDDPLYNPGAEESSVRTNPVASTLRYRLIKLVCHERKEPAQDNVRPADSYWSRLSEVSNMLSALPASVNSPQVAVAVFDRACTGAPSLPFTLRVVDTESSNSQPVDIVIPALPQALLQERIDQLTRSFIAAIR